MNKCYGWSTSYKNDMFVNLTTDLFQTLLQIFPKSGQKLYYVMITMYMGFAKSY